MQPSKDFGRPQLASRLDKLMGSNLACLIDREYMQQLQERILEEYAESMDNRIRIREKKEVERVKSLVLSGRISLNQAPETMTNHPIMMIEKDCKRFSSCRRVKHKMPRVHNPTHLYSDESPAGLLSQLSSTKAPLSEEFSFSLPGDNLFEVDDPNEKDVVPHMKETTKTLITDECQENDKNVLVSADNNTLKNKNPLVGLFKRCKTVEEMFVLADEIIGILENNVRTLSKNHEDLLSLQSSIGSSAAASNFSDSNKIELQN